MKSSSDYRKMAREALKGKWGIAILTGFVAGLLGGDGGVSVISFDMNNSAYDTTKIYDVNNILSVADGIKPEILTFVIGIAIFALIAILIVGVVLFVICSCVRVGYARFNMNLLDGNHIAIDQLFMYFSKWKRIAYVKFIEGLYVFLWSLILIIPGIVKSYSYAMTSYILAENPELSPSEAIAQSCNVMRGNKERLFFLHISFILWSLLAVLTLGIGFFWLIPYMNAAEAAFYRDICPAPIYQNEML